MRKSWLLFVALALSFFATSANAQIKIHEIVSTERFTKEIPDCNFEKMVKSFNFRTEKMPYNDGYAILTTGTFRRWPAQEIEIKNCKIQNISQKVFRRDDGSRHKYLELVLYQTNSIRVTGIDKSINFKIWFDVVDLSQKIVDEVFLSGKISLYGGLGVIPYSRGNSLATPQDPNDFEAIKIRILPYENTIQAGK